jgi:hypothetical protein
VAPSSAEQALILERLRPFTVHEISLFSDTKHVYLLLIRLAFKAIKHMLDVHIAGDKLRALV